MSAEMRGAGARTECHRCDGQGLVPDDTGMLIDVCGLCEGCGRIALLWRPDKEWGQQAFVCDVDENGGQG